MKQLSNTVESTVISLFKFISVNQMAGETLKVSNPTSTRWYSVNSLLQTVPIKNKPLHTVSSELFHLHRFMMFYKW